MKKKKVLAIVLCVCFSVAVVVGSIIAITASVTQVVGTEAARILNARDRLNISYNEGGSWNEIMGEVQSQNNLLNKFSAQSKKIGSNLAVAGVEKSNKVLPGTVVSENAAAKVYKDGEKYYFQNLSGASYTGIVIESRFFGIDFTVERACEVIDLIKNKLNVTNKWVSLGYGEYLLTVEDNCEKLFSRSKSEGKTYISVCVRTTRDDAKSVYQIYEDELDDQLKPINPSYLVYIPNERYEYYYEHEGQGITDYVVAENDRGFWNVYMPDYSKTQNVLDHSNLIINDGIAYYSVSSDMTADSNKIEYIEGGRIISADLKNDVLSMANSDDDFNSGLHLKNITNLSHFVVDEKDVVVYDSAEFSGYNVNYSSNIDVVLENGNVIKYGDVYTTNYGTVEIGKGSSDFFPNPGFADVQQSASISLKVSGDSLNEKINNLYAFFEQVGIEFAYEKSQILKGFEIGDNMFDSINDSYLWNGHRVNSIGEFIEGQKQLHKTWENLNAEFVKVKDNESQSVMSLSKVSSRTSFATVSGLVGANNTYLNNVISIDNLSLTVNKSNLLEKGKPYVLKVGVSMVGENNSFGGEHTVGLKAKNGEQTFLYENANLTLTQSGEYQLPEILDEGSYVVVAYVATADEEIRVSEIMPIAFINTAEETIENTFSIRKVWGNNGNLMVSYTPNLEIVVSMKELKEFYTYKEVRKALMSQILSIGYPIYGEKIVDQNNQVVDENAQLSSGTYKLKFHVPTKQAILGYAEAFVIVEIK